MKNHLDENKLKEILNKKEFEFREEAWNKFDMLQKESIQPRDNRPYLILLLLLIGIAITGFFFTNSHTTQTLTADTLNENKLSSIAISKHDEFDIENINRIRSTENSNLNQNTTESTDVINKLGKLSTATNSSTTIQNTKSTKSQKNIKKASSNNSSTNQLFAQSTNNYPIKTSESPELISNEFIQNNSVTETNKNNLSITKASDTPTIKSLYTKDDLEPLQLLSINGIAYNRLNTWAYNLPRAKEKNINPDLDRSIKIYGSSLLGLGNKQNFHTTHTVGAELVLSRKISLESGLGYKWNNVDQLDSHRGFSTKYNSFSQQFYHNSIEADKMHFIHVPIILNYHLNKKLISSVGSYYNFLFLTKGTITGNKDGELEERSTWIAEDGIQRHQLGLSLSLRYALSQNIQIESGYKQNLTKSFILTNGENTRLGDFFLGLKYYL